MPVLETALGAASRVGPYFTVVSFVPAAVLTISLVFVVAAEPWTGNPDWPGALTALATPSLGQFAALLTGVMVIALVQHPLQYPLVQLMEGYWGTGSVALGLARTRIRQHLNTLTSLEDLRDEATDAADDLREAYPGTPEVDITARWAAREAERLIARFPDREDVRPTMLGSALRKYERQAGEPYRLNIVVSAPHLLLVAPPGDAAYVRDQRTQLDLATRLCATCLMLSAAVAVLLAPSGLWMLLAAIPYLLAQLFYRGACTVAHEYGSSLQTLVDLNRPALYTRMRVPMPATLESEQVQNEILTEMLGRRTAQRMDLSDPATPGAG